MISQRVFRVALWAGCLLSPLLAQAQQTARRPTGTSKRSALAAAFVQPPRELRLLLTKVQKARSAGNLADLAAGLGELTKGIAASDYLVADDDGGGAASMKGRVAQVFRSLTDKERDAYETLHGAAASTQLNEALKEGDRRKLETVAHRWFHTQAGYEASALLARHMLDEQRPDDAASHLERLLSAPHARIRFDAEASVLLAVARLMKARVADARRVLDNLRSRQPDAVTQFGGQSQALFVPGEDPLEKLRGLLAGLQRAAPPNDGWLVFRGDASRNKGGGPSLANPGKAAWTTKLITKPATEARVRSTQQTSWQNETPIIPAIHPIAAQKQIVVRTPERIAGVDRASGELLWSYPFNYEEVAAAPATRANNRVVRIRVNGMAVGGPVSPGQRVWEDSLFSQLSSDGRRVYALDRLESTVGNSRQQIVLWRAGLARGRTAQMPAAKNQLVALDVRREGALCWTVGGETGEMEPALKGAFFLGPPLPVHDTLYVLFERSDVVSLAALDSETGQLLWSLKLAPIANRSVQLDQNRRLNGGSPSFHDGILVCPTTIGGVAAVDVSRRVFLWGYAEPQTANRRVINGVVVPINVMNSSFGNSVSKWNDATLTVADDRILYTPSYGDLQCLDLKTGKLLWRRKRSSMRFVAGVHKGVVLLAGKHRYTGLKLKDGQPAWPESPYRAIPGGGMPAGRGVRVADQYYLPTTDPELLKIDFVTGEFQRQKLKTTLGNLVSVNDTLMSLDPMTLVAYRDAPGAGDEEKPQNTDDETTANLEKKSCSALTAELGNESFAIRQAAGELLKKRGRESVTDLSAAVKSTDLEMAYRATHLLLSLLRGSDPETAAAARKALSENQESTSVVSAVNAELKRQEQQAVTRLTQLGAFVRNGGAEVMIRTTWRGAGADLRLLKWLRKLTSLELISEKVTDSWLEHIRPLANLQSLTLRRARISDEGVPAISGLTKLRTLSLHGAKITDASVPVIAKLKNLASLNLTDTRISPEGFAKLKKALPGAKIVH